MSPRRHINQAGLDIIMKAEGLRNEPYMDKNDGWTVGWGHLLLQDELRDGKPIKAHYTQEECEDLLRIDVALAEAAVTIYVLDHENLLNENEFSALVSFVYNIGPYAFKNSTMLDLLNQGDKAGAAGWFDRWILDDGEVMPGLVKRRRLEKELFSSKEKEDE